MNLKDDTVFITGLFHDISKINTYKWIEDTKAYEKINHHFLKHGELSVQLLRQHLGFLEENEVAMIRYHMGAFDEYEPYNELNNAMRKYPEVVAMCCADWEAGRILEDNLYEKVKKTN